jgi:hypothetical protein
MYVCYIVARSGNHCCHGIAIIRFLFIVVSVDVAVNNIKVFNVATDTPQWAPFILLSSYKIFRTAVNNNKC